MSSGDASSTGAEQPRMPPPPRDATPATPHRGARPRASRQRQLRHDEVRQERDHLLLLLRSLPNPIIVMDERDEAILMSHAALRLVQAAQSGSATSPREQWCADNNAKFRLYLSRVRRDVSGTAGGEVNLTDPDTEEPVTMSVTTTDVRDDRGAVVATVSVMQDVSRLRELERQRLEPLLLESEKLAATGRLAASIAHEINNPLEAIKNALYLLNSTLPGTDPSHKFLEIATHETDRVSRIVRQMLGFYRPPRMEPIDLNALVEEAEALVQKQLLQRRVRIENDLDPGVPHVVASADQLKQVLLNLLLNAQEAMSEGGTVYVSTRAALAADHQYLRSESVHIQIRDTGTGIAEEHLSHIFEPFFSTKTEQKGTGLGLWESFGIVQNHGGSLKVRSSKHRGTTFTISLPIGGPEPAEETPEVVAGR